MIDNPIVAPVGDIVYMKLNGKNKDGLYHICVRFKDGEPGVDEFKAKIAAINGALIVDSSVNPSVPNGHFQLKCKTKQEVKVFMGDANTGESTLLQGDEIPGFYAGDDEGDRHDTGQAIVVLRPSKEGMGTKPTVYLNSVTLVNMNLAPRTEPEYKSLINEQLKALAS